MNDAAAWSAQLVLAEFAVGVSNPAQSVAATELTRNRAVAYLS